MKWPKHIKLQKSKLKKSSEVIQNMNKNYNSVQIILK